MAVDVAVDATCVKVGGGNVGGGPMGCDTLVAVGPGVDASWAGAG